MAKFQQIKSFNSAFGGDEYRVTSDGETVNYQIKTRSASSFRTIGSESYKDFEKFAEDCALFDSYNDNPAVIAHRVERLH